jgi:hypothetical protein
MKTDEKIKKIKETNFNLKKSLHPRFDALMDKYKSSPYLVNRIAGAFNPKYYVNSGHNLADVLMDVYESKGFEKLISGMKSKFAGDLAAGIGQTVKWNFNQKDCHELISMLDSYKSTPVIGCKIVRAVNEVLLESIGDAKMLVEVYGTQEFRKLVDDMKPKTAGHIIDSIEKTAESLLNPVSLLNDCAASVVGTKAVKGLVKVLCLYKEKVSQWNAAQVARNTAEIAKETDDYGAIATYLNIHCLLNPLKLDPFVFDEFKDYLIRYPKHARAIDEFVKTDHAYLSEQAKEIAAPLTVILSLLMNRTGYLSHVYKIKLLDEAAQLNLARAWTIAYKNKKSENEDYLSDFYNGLKEILDNDPENIGKWAETVVKDFRKDSGSDWVSKVVNDEP